MIDFSRIEKIVPGSKDGSLALLFARAGDRLVVTVAPRFRNRDTEALSPLTLTGTADELTAVFASGEVEDIVSLQGRLKDGSHAASASAKTTAKKEDLKRRAEALNNTPAKTSSTQAGKSGFDGKVVAGDNKKEGAGPGKPAPSLPLLVACEGGTPGSATATEEAKEVA